MGIFDKLLGSIGSGSGRRCPDCGESLWDDSGSGRYECRNDSCAGWGVYFDVDGDLLDPPSRSERTRTERRCIGCDTPMKNAEFTAAWEHGDNADAYVTCPSCGYQNIF